MLYIDSIYPLSLYSVYTDTPQWMRYCSVSFLSFAALENLPYRGFASNFTSTTTTPTTTPSLVLSPPTPILRFFIYRNLLVSSSASLPRATSLSSVRLLSPQWTGNDGGRVARRCWSRLCFCLFRTLIPDTIPIFSFLIRFLNERHSCNWVPFPSQVAFVSPCFFRL